MSATFLKTSLNMGSEADQSKDKVILFKPEVTAPAATNSPSKDPKPSVGGPIELKGLSIINQGHLTLHYHTYNDASSPAPQPAIADRKHALERSEEEEYSEALSSLLDFNLSPAIRPDPPVDSKRQRLEEPEIEVVEPEAQQEEEQVKQEGEQPVHKKKNKNGMLCKKCGNTCKHTQNKDSKQPCNFHPGMSTTPHHVTPDMHGFRPEVLGNCNTDHAFKF